MVSLNATTYVAEITADTPFGTSVLYLSAVIDGSAFAAPVVLLTLVQSGLRERVFMFSNGRTYEDYFDLTPDPTTNTITIVNQLVYSDDPRNTPQGVTPPTLPATFGITISLVAIDIAANATVVVDRIATAFVIVNPPPGEYLGHSCFCM